MSHLLTYIASQSWFVHGPIAENTLAVVTRHLRERECGVPGPDAQAVAEVVRAREIRRSAVTRARSGLVAVGGTRGMSLDPDDGPLYYRGGNDGRIAVVPVDGLLCKYASMINGASQPRGMTPADVRYAMVTALQSGTVDTLVLDIDSPGGTVAGGHDLVDAVAEAREVSGGKVPIVAYAHDLCASGAYLLASQCDEVHCSEQAAVGSIGVYQVIFDESKRLENEGVRAVLVSSGPFKGAGAEGVAVSEAHLTSFQNQVDEMCRWFVGRVADGRGMSVGEADALATGDVWIGPRAVAAGLCDSVVGFRELLVGLEQQTQTL